MVCLLALGLAGVVVLRATAQDDSTAADGPSAATVEAGEPSASPGGEITDVGPVAKTFDRYDALLASLTIFVLAVFVGFEVITKVPPTLHTPLMSGSNAISGITIVGAILATGYGKFWLVAVVGMIALALAAINVVGGFLVTHRMLEMFRKKK